MLHHAPGQPSPFLLPCRSEIFSSAVEHSMPLRSSTSTLALILLQTLRLSRQRF